jgi:hypothetical protein
MRRLRLEQKIDRASVTDAGNESSSVRQRSGARARFDRMRSQGNNFSFRLVPKLAQVTGKRLLPAVEALPADAQLATYLHLRRPALRLAQGKCDLLLGRSSSSHPADSSLRGKVPKSRLTYGAE